MAFFRVGMRVKKVAGINNIGATGKVFGIEVLKEGDKSPNGGVIWCLKNSFSDLQVLMDSQWLNSSGEMRPANLVSLSYRDLWEPIIDKHEPCESEFKASLDRLLEKVGEGV